MYWIKTSGIHDYQFRCVLLDESLTVSVPSCQFSVKDGNGRVSLVELFINLMIIYLLCDAFACVWVHSLVGGRHQESSILRSSPISFTETESRIQTQSLPTDLASLASQPAWNIGPSLT